MKNEPTKAFIFDMDGVIVNSEPVWARYEAIFLPKLFSDSIYQQIKDQILGNTADAIFQLALENGVQISKKVYIDMLDQYAKKVYIEAELAPGLDTLIDKLIRNDYQLGLVSASRQNWIDIVLGRLTNSDQFKFVASTNDLGIPPKPSPQGYLKAIKALGAIPKTSIIIEDSKKGIQAALASQAYTICFTKYLPKNYLPSGVNKYINNLREAFPL